MKGFVRGSTAAILMATIALSGAPSAAADDPDDTMVTTETPTPSESTTPTDPDPQPSEASPSESTPPAEKPTKAVGGAIPAGTSGLPAELSDIEPPYLRWRVLDEGGNAIEGTIWEVKGPGASESTATVEDNTGQEDYKGADLDETPGVLLVKEFVEDDDPEATHPVAENETYQLIPAKADGFAVGEDAERHEIAVSSSEEQEIQEIVLASAEAVARGAEQQGEANLDGPIGITPMALGPDGDGVQAPYVYWTVKHTSGTLVGGASFLINGPATGNWWNSNASWPNSSTTVTDCVLAPCAGPDRDPDPGEFLVMSFGTHTVSASNRYRIQQSTAPTGYTFVNASNWVSIPGKTGSFENPAQPRDGAWQASTYDFGNFPVRRNSEGQYAPQCTAGYVYGILSTGQIRQVAPNGTVTNLGSASSLTSANFNGLGIGTGGSPVFAYSRGGTGNSDSNVAIYKFDIGTGTWSAVGHNVNSNTNDRTVTFVAGAVSLDTGTFFLGGYSAAGDNRVFRLWEYNPATNTSTYKGHISTPSSGSANGDIAFDASGNLFVIRGTGSTTTIYSVTAANLAAANGGLIPSSGSSAVDGTTSDVNGVAFDADGRGFLSSSSTVQRYNMPGWTSQTSVTSSLNSGSNSNDLASCGSPPTITIEKVIEGGRVNSGDQFTLTLRRDTASGTVLGTTTTTGSATGLQGQRVGPLPTVRNVPLYFSETGSGTTDLSKYVSSYRCTVDGVQTVQGNGVSGSITIPSSGQEVNCQFVNSPLVARLTIHKDVTDATGQNPASRSGWTVGATGTATTGTVTKDPTANTQATNASGNASWTFTFGDKTHRATVNVNETVSSNYQFLRGECVIVHLDGSTSTTTLTGAANTALTGIAPGDQIACTYVNKPSPGELRINKAFDNVPAGSGDITFSGTYSCTLSGVTVASGTWTRTGSGAATLTAGSGQPLPTQIPVGASCTAAETQPTGSVGLPNSSWVWDTYSVSPAVTIESPGPVTITVTNKAKRVYGSFSVTKAITPSGVADAGLLFGGAWTCTLANATGTGTPAEIKTGTWGTIAVGATWTSGAAAQIPLGATCVVTSESTRPAWPVASDHSYVWGTANLGSSVTAATDANTAKITVTNPIVREFGALAITKAFGSPMPSDPGPGLGQNNVGFSGTYECKIGATVVASGTWTRTGAGVGSLTPTIPSGGSAGTSQPVPVGATCTVTETPPAAGAGMPNTSWQWDVANIDISALTPSPIAKDTTSVVTVTNKAKRIYGNFSITKVITPTGIADSELGFGGGWSCTLAGETKTGTWSVTDTGTWTSTSAELIPLGATCTVTSESTRPLWPVAADHSYVWGTANLGSAVAAAADASTAKITVTNPITRQLGTLAITKAFDSVPSGYGNIAFGGTYTCTLNSATVASGTWSVTGEGAATLTPPGTGIPVGSSCEATETPPTGNSGLPNSSWEWDTHSVGPAVTITNNSTVTITVTNKAKRVYGNFSVTKAITPSGIADAGLLFGGAWECTLANAAGTDTPSEVKTGTWGDIAVGGTWSSTLADEIPLGANCVVTSESTRPEWPVANDHSYEWDVAALGGAVTAAVDGSTATITVTNPIKRIVGALAIVKAFDGVPAGHGVIEFTGAYTCTLNSATVASGTWKVTGEGNAELTPDSGSLDVDEIPIGASCSATETQPTGSTGLPNSSWTWDAYTVSAAVTIENPGPVTITVTNKAKRVYGNFSVTKLVAPAGAADSALQYEGTWECTLADGQGDGEVTQGGWGPIADGGVWDSTAADEIPLGSTCAVKTETRPGSPVALDPSYQWDGDPTFSAAVVTISGTPLPVITVTNTVKRVLGSVTWRKVAAGSNTPLRGSEWKIVGPSPATTEIAVVDCVEDDDADCTGPDKDGRAGYFKVTELAWGSYQLIETMAPPGYVLDATPHAFTIGADELYPALGTITNNPGVTPDLPLTGGISRDFYTLLGVGVIGMAMISFGVARSRTRRRIGVEG